MARKRLRRDRPLANKRANASVRVARGVPVAGVLAVTSGLHLLENLEASGNTLQASLIRDLLKGMTPLEGAWAVAIATSQRLYHALALLKTAGADILARDDCRFTLLHTATLENCPTKVQFLLGIERRLIHVPAFDSMTALHFAAQCGNVECLRILIEHRADIKRRNANGENAIHVAAKYNHPECLKLLLSKRGQLLVDEIDCNWNTALHFAAEAGGKESIEVLLSHGANVNVQNMNGFTPLYGATASNYTGCMQLLIDGGANVDIPQYTGKTPLHIAVLNSWTSSLRLLIAASAKLDVKERLDCTPLDFAVQHGDVRCVELLIAAGAPVDLATLANAEDYNALECIPLLMKRYKKGLPANMKKFQVRARKPSTRQNRK